MSSGPKICCWSRGAATEAIKEGIPAIAFSGATGEQRYVAYKPVYFLRLIAEILLKIIHYSVSWRLL